MVADELDAWNDDGVRIQASGRWTLQGVGVLLGGAMVAPPCSSKKTRKHEGERERGKPRRRRETRDGTAWRAWRREPKLLPPARPSMAPALLCED